MTTFGSQIDEPKCLSEGFMIKSIFANAIVRAKISTNKVIKLTN